MIDTSHKVQEALSRADHADQEWIPIGLDRETGWLSATQRCTRGELHSMWNAGTEPAQMIEIISPAGFEKYFIELAEATAAAGGRRPDPSVTAPIAERFGLSADFDEVPDLVARHQLRAPR
jgi:hypothetical protein